MAETHITTAAGANNHQRQAICELRFEVIPSYGAGKG
jgi:hypothetical protein